MSPGPRLLLWLLGSHFLFDYPLQGDFLARAKRRGGVPGVPWYHALSAHAFLQAAGVLALTGSIALFCCELAAHAGIDYWKCAQGGFGTQRQEAAYDLDQLLHIVCKVVWVFLLAVRLA